MEFDFHFLNLREVQRLSGLGKTTIYRYMAEGTFPRNVSLGGRSVAWVSTEIEEWMRERVEDRYEPYGKYK
ncbi:MAG TPA: AlpA family transcriptional regulator [Alcanivoracaceae bacterium]|nr:AlpA family transcriptional regulator [Alcanivoracaceae bacterium]